MRPFIAVIALISLSLLVGCNSQEGGRSAESTSRPTPAGQTAQQSAQSTNTARRITADELYKLFQKNEVLIVDTRHEPAFKQGHIRGAILIPTNEFADRAGELPKNRMIVTYCT
jgi:3-mercaptopyruvate sulfurtransferase SseA